MNGTKDGNSEQQSKKLTKSTFKSCKKVDLYIDICQTEESNVKFLARKLRKREFITLLRQIRLKKS